MTWWFKVPASLGADPSFDEVGLAGFLAWTALVAVDSKEDFGAQIPPKYASARHLCRQLPDDTPRELIEDGLAKCKEHGLVNLEGDDVYVLDRDLYERWRGPKSGAQRVREHRARRRHAEPDTPVTQNVTPDEPALHASCDVTDSGTDTPSNKKLRQETDGNPELRAVTLCNASNATRPDQTRPNQTRESLRGRSGAHTLARESAEPKPENQLSSLRQRYGFGLDEAARLLDLPRVELEALDRGEREPTPQERELLDYLRRFAAGEVAIDLSHEGYVLRSKRREVAKQIWRYQDEVRCRVEPDIKPLKLNELPGGPLDAIVLAMATWTPAECKHALDMAGAEAACRKAAGEDPFQYLNGRTNWKPEQIERHAQTSPEKIRARFKSRGPRGLKDEPNRKFKRLG